MRILGAPMVVLAVTASLASCSADSSGSASSSSTVSPVVVPAVTRVRAHEYVEGESFTYVYDNTEAVYATVPTQGGKVPRVTDLEKVDQVRVTVRYTIVADGDTLQKRMEFIDPVYREATAEELATAGGTGAFEPLANKLPGFPTTTTYTYPVGQDGQTALKLGEVFAGHFDVFLYRYIDVFNLPAYMEGVSQDMEPGDWSTNPPVEVDLGGVPFHNGSPNVFYARIDQIDGQAQAFLKVQNAGNYIDAVGMESNYVQTMHVPLEGPTAGLASGELQEILYLSGGDGEPTATIRQVTMTLQSETTRDAIDAG
jgi:hypothetical protein